MAKEEFQCVPITPNRTRPESLLRLQVIFEKCKYHLAPRFSSDASFSSQNLEALSRLLQQFLGDGQVYG
jgi:hypothetical protein